MTNTIMGMDEAGRGAVIGPLVMVAVILKSNELHRLQQFDIKDSKKYTGPKRVEQRRTIATKLKKVVDHVKIIEIPAEEITNSPNLTKLQIERAVNAWLEFKPTLALFDAIGPLNYFCKTFFHILCNVSSSNTSFALEDKKIHAEEAFIVIKDECNEMRTIKVLNKGDQKEPIISAASIIAKDYRDWKIREIEKEWGFTEGRLGSGYPSMKDDRLLEFLKIHEANIRKRRYPFIRYNWNWQPLQDVLRRQSSLKDFI